jgi:hypothetical protein
MIINQRIFPTFVKKLLNIINPPYNKIFLVRSQSPFTTAVRLLAGEAVGDIFCGVKFESDANRVDQHFHVVA